VTPLGRALRAVLAGSLAAAVTVGGVALIAAPAGANITTTWTGASLSPQWTQTSNWTGGIIPHNNDNVSFPVLPPACSRTTPPGTCYVSSNNIGNLTVNQIAIDGSTSYLISGNSLTVGPGGISDVGPAAPTPASTTLSLPLVVPSHETWTVSGNSGQHLIVSGGVTGAGALTINLGGGPTLRLPSAETAPIGIAGTSGSSGPDASANGIVNIGSNGDLNGTNANLVEVVDAELTGSGTTGPLITSGADLQVGVPGTNPGTLAANGAVTLDSATQLGIGVTQFGSTPGTDFAQLSASGTVALGGARLATTFGAPGACFAPPLGAVYPVVSTTGTLTGQVSSPSGTPAPDGSTIPLSTASGCPTSPYELRINYNTGPSPQTVTATVVAPTTTTITATPSTVSAGQTVTYAATVASSATGATPTGSVTFTTGGVILCTAALSGGSGQCTASNAPTGADTVTGTYGGDTRFQGSAGTTGLFVLQPTTTTIGVSPTTTPFGGTVTYSATVAPTAGSGTPSGTVAFTIGSTTLCTATLSGGTGSCTANNAPQGTDTVTGTYGGDAVFAGSQGTTTLTVTAPTARPTTTTVGVSPTTTPFGGTVTYSATVAPTAGSGTPTGTVAFTIGSTTLCTATLSGGSGSCTAANAPVGTDTVTGTYSGDTSFLFSSGTTTLTVTPTTLVPTTTTVTVNPTTTVFGNSVTYSATVAPTSGPGTPTGTVSFGTGATTLCTATLSGGTGSCTAINAPIGTDTVTGTYGGDTAFATSSGTATLVVNPAPATPTVTQISVTPSSVTLGDTVTYSATVTPASGPGTPTGTVAFTVNGSPLCTATLSGGTGSCTSTLAPVGTDTITGSYSGDTTFGPSAGLTTLTVAPPSGARPTTTTITATPSTVSQHQVVTYAATVAPTTGPGTPTGTVTFTINGGTLCTATLSGGSGSCTSSLAPVGVNTVLGSYSGDANFQVSSGTTTLTVNGVASPTVTTIQVNPTSVTFGDTVTYSATVAPTSGSGTPSGTVDFTIGSTDLCTATLSGGTGSCTAINAPVGTDTVLGSYSGDPSFNPSSGTTTLTVAPPAGARNTITTITVTPTTVAFGNTVTYSASVTPATGSGTPTGTVVFTTGSTSLCTATLAGGSGSCQATNAPVGTDIILGSYSGDPNFKTSTGTTTLTVTGAGTTTTITVNPTRVTQGASVTYSASVTGNSSLLRRARLSHFAPLTPTGTVTFSTGSTTLCTVTLSGGAGSCMATTAPAGTDVITGHYSGDANFTASQGQTTLVVLYPPGYWLVAADGGIFNFGYAKYYGSMGGMHLNQPVVGMAATPTLKGYWEVAADGGIFAFGNAGYFGSMGGRHLNKPVVGMATTPDGRGYWLVASDGGIFSFGDAVYHGSMGGMHLNAPVVGMAATPDGGGYWLVAADGGIFAFGDAGYYGSMGGRHLNRPVTGMAASPTGHGYWLVAADGGIFAFGDAPFLGSMGGLPPAKAVVAVGRDQTGLGYWLTGEAGNVYPFGDAPFLGSMAGQHLNAPVVGLASA
jgi:hypothetical protein